MSNKPNLIYIFADQLRYSSVGFNGDAQARTPHLDALAAQCTNLEGAISGHPVCAPYRASLFTGKYTTSTGMVINEIRMKPDHHPHCFAHQLNDAGYRTSYIGKWHLYAAELGNHYDPKNSYIPKGPDRLGFNEYFAAYNFHHDYYGAAAYYHLDSPEKHYCERYEPDVQTDMAIQQLDLLTQQDKPFALFLSLGTPHDPWIPQNVPGECMERFMDVEFTLPANYLPDNDPHADNWARLSEQERQELTSWMRCYYAMTANLDDNIGRLIAHIKELGLYDNSILVFTSDHGELFGAHGRRAKNIFYEEAIRVPFLIRHGNKLAADTRRDFVFNTVDVMPTLLTMMNLDIPGEVEGSDYSQCITGDADTQEGALMMCTGPTAVYGDGNEWRGWRTKQFTYAIFKVDGQEHLYDNLADPLQQNNLAGRPEYKTLQEKLKANMWAKMNGINDTFEHNSYYQQHWIENRLIHKTATCG